MPSDPKANPDVLHVDGQTRDADELITVTLRRGQWVVVLGAASSYDVRVPREQGDGGACLDAIREAIESQSDRTSIEATPTEPVYEWRLLWAKGDRSGALGPFKDQAYVEMRRDDMRHGGWTVCVDRRTAPAPGPWERVDDGGRRDG